MCNVVNDCVNFDIVLNYEKFPEVWCLGPKLPVETLEVYPTYYFFLSSCTCYEGLNKKFQKVF